MPDSTTIPFLLWLLVIIPGVAIRAWWRIRAGKPLPSKPRRYQAMIGMQVLVFILALQPARQNSVALFQRGFIPAWAWLAAAAYLVVIALRIKAAWPRVTAARRQRARLILPENLSEIRYWIPISFLAGVTEEYAYRGVAYAALSEITRSPAIAVAICTVAFAVAHIFQGWRGVLAGAVLALLFHWIVFLTQTLLLAMAIHVTYDLIVGFVGMHALMHDVAVKHQAMSAGS